MPSCLVCKSHYEPFMNFGEMPIANAFISVDEFETEYEFLMQVGFCETCKMVQLVDQPDREKMFHGQYAFYSSTSRHMSLHFEKFASFVTDYLKLNEQSFVVEVGSNDGILLQNFLKNKIPCLGVEPSKNVAQVAAEKGIEVVTEFFDETLASCLVQSHRKADAILSANVMCHIPYVHSIYSGVKRLLSADGCFIFEDPYLGDVIRKTSFDQIYDEHVFLFSGLSVSYLADMHGLELVDVCPQETHGGSMRYTIAHKGAKPVSSDVEELLKTERAMGLDRSAAYSNFANSDDKIKSHLMRVLTDLNKQG